MDIQKEREAFEKYIQTVAHPHRSPKVMFFTVNDGHGNVIYCDISIQDQWETWLAAKAQAVPAQLDVNSILHDIDCYFDNGLSNTERTANNLLQSIYEKLSGEVKAQEPTND